MAIVEVECYHFVEDRFTREQVTYRWQWAAKAMVWLINRKNDSLDVWKARLLT